MNSTLIGSEGFAQVVALNEASKALLSRSFSVNLLALDAMIQSKRGGGNLRGFDEVSSQMRTWSRDLHHELERLGELSRSIVARTSLASKQAHLIRLLQQAADRSDVATLTATCKRFVAAQQGLEEQLVRDWRAARQLLADLDQLGMMAIVLSRSAMIEAASGNADQREQLNHVSSEFYRNSQDVIDAIKLVSKRLSER